jgi:hypothetical protein
VLASKEQPVMSSHSSNGSKALYCAHSGLAGRGSTYFVPSPNPSLNRPTKSKPGG